MRTRRRGAMIDARTAKPAAKMCYDFVEQQACTSHFMGPRGTRWDARPCVWRPWETVWPEDEELKASRGQENVCQVLPQGSCAGVEVYSVAKASAPGGQPRWHSRPKHGE